MTPKPCSSYWIYDTNRIIALTHEALPDKHFTNFSSLILHSLNMDTTTVYTVAIGGIFLLFVLFRILHLVASWSRPIKVIIARYLIYPYVLRRHSLIGPWN
jgi:hypothetical protein